MKLQILESDFKDDLVSYVETIFLNPKGEDVEIQKVQVFDKDAYKVITIDTYKKLKGHAKFFLLFNSQKDREAIDEVAKIGRTTPECLGVIDLHLNEGFYIPFIESFLDSHNVMASQKTLVKKLNGVLQNVLSQLQRVKGIHEQMVPVRKEHIRGLTLSSRFCAGTSSGGEFFDFFKVGNTIWLFSVNASSYIIIGTFLSIVENWKDQATLDEESILQTLKSSVGDFKGIGEASIFITKISLGDLSLSYLNIGDHEVVSKEKVLIKRNSSSYPDKFEGVEFERVRLARGERFLFLSPGFFKNTGEQLSSKNYYTFIKENWLGALEMIQELTFQSKKKYTELDFMPYDQTILTLEVDRNAISKV